MQLTTKTDVSNGIVNIFIFCSDISTETESALNDFPRFLRYKDINFSGMIAVIDELPILVDANDPRGNIVTLDLVDKSFRLDKDFAIELKIDSQKLPTSELNTDIYNFEILAKAKALIYEAKVKECISKLLESARTQAAASIEKEIQEIF